MESCRLTIRALPGARHDAVDGAVGDTIKVRLKAPAVDGKANRALLAFLARQVGCRTREIRLVTGETSRLKIVEIQGTGIDEARNALLGKSL